MIEQLLTKDLHSVLKKILEKKYETVKHKKIILPLDIILQKIEESKYVHRNFKNAIKRKPNRISIIGECKRATPSKGILKENYQLENIATAYFNTGMIDALSVLTEEKFFDGDIYHIVRVRTAVPLPVLRKDFIIDEYQIYESVYYGADAILLISSILTEEELKRFYSLAKSLSLEVMFEVHTVDDVNKILDLQPEIVGINNRDLRNFNIDITTTEKLRKFIPSDVVVVSESGIMSKKEFEYVKNLDIDAVLIGTYFMQSSDVSHAVKSLVGEE